MKFKILIVEDNFVEANHLQVILEGAGYRVCPIAHSVSQALKIIDEEHPDFVLLDIFLKGKLSGIDLARMLRERDIPFVYLSANSNKSILDEAKATQPYGFLVKPFRDKDVLVTLDIAHYLHEHSLEARLRREAFLKKKATSPAISGPPDDTCDIARTSGLIGESPAFKQSIYLAQTVAVTDTSVLLLGESGTGKEKLTDFIHRTSARRNGPLIKVNCSSLPYNLLESELFGHERGAFTGATERRKGKFELAEGGTVFLDEVADIPFELQSKLLRVLQEKEVEPIGSRTPVKVNVRFVASTNRSLEKEISEGRFRIDLYYRLNVFPIVLPPLRDRQEDILLLAQHFMDRFAEQTERPVTPLSEAAIESMIRYNWPGNVRELEHFMERNILLGGSGVIIRKSDIVSYTATNSKAAMKTLEENERDHIVTALAKCNGKVSGEGGAAQMLGINVSTLNAKIRKLGIQKQKVR
jgi:two-component system response regulator HydG